MNEDFLWYLWQYHFAGKSFEGTQQETLQILHPGKRNIDSGPDFFNGKIKIGHTVWAGNIEIHVRSSDWYRHGHQHDEQYDSVILHVVYEDDRAVFRRSGEKITTLEIKGKFDEKLFETYRGFLLSKQWIPCQEIISRAGYFHILQWLQRLAVERLERKAGETEKQLHENHHDFREVFYRSLLQSYGLKTNAEAFLQLARSLPYSVLSKHKDNLKQIEALLFGQAGMLTANRKDNYPNQLKTEYIFLAQKYGLTPLSEKIWKFMRTHPSNFPTLRTAQFASLFHRSSSLLQKMLESNNLQDLTRLFQTEASEYWQTHYRFDKSTPPHSSKMGISSIRLILINTVIPFLFVYGRTTGRPFLQEKALNWLTQLPAENNRFTRRFAALGIRPGNALQSQALIRLKQVYCDKKQCLQCGIGHQLLKSAETR